ncbi:MAG: single-stranded-DNA-specific exonuclease RecJ [Flavobacteriales bacterium]|nr:single-stranded-DNA-specific exonuclease RecJ [Flavobacteriales bacterium]|tara:strand:+ start:419 stop:2104 length:1686 start_codon:yes stop_codon:yes gene_type:complete
MKNSWEIAKTDQNLVEKISRELKVSEIIAHLLVLRGVSTYQEAERFFRPKILNLHDPYLMKGMNEAVKRIELAINRKEGVLIYGDYDVDGTTSVAMMYSFMTRFIDNVGYYIPDRYSEGYGVSFQGIDYAQDNNYSLIIALDCGIRAVKQIDYASNKNIDFIVCDHHNPGVNIPRAVSILNPKQIGCNYPFKELSGCGVGFKLIQALSYNLNIEFTQIAEYLDLVSISIGADIVDITGENRILAFYGLRIINKSPRVGIQTLMNKIKRSKKLDMLDVIFGIAPRINAAGRINHGKVAVGLLVENHLKEAGLISEEIEKYNTERKDLDKSITSQALEMVDIKRRSNIVYNDSWHKGVVGIVASRLIEQYYKPTIVLTKDGENYTGSARSVKGFNIYNALLECDHLLEKFGGHKYAAGLSVKSSNLKLFIEEFEKIVCRVIGDNDAINVINVDMDINLNDINFKLHRIIEQFAPFGPKNRSPLFITRNISEITDLKRIGKNKDHISMNIRINEKTIKCIGFNLSHLYDSLSKKIPFDMCYSIHKNEWQGATSLQLRIKDVDFH